MFPNMEDRPRLKGMTITTVIIISKHNFSS
jgi:hypothetical protein